MTEQDQPRSRQDVEARIIAKAWTDESFAEALRSSPKTAIESELGIEVPEDLKIEVHEESLDSGTWHLVIPPRPPSLDLEMSDEELEAVAGGLYRSTELGVRAGARVALDPERGGMAPWFGTLAHKVRRR